MKFNTTCHEIKKSIQILSPIINYNHPELAFRYLLLRKKNDRIEIKAYNDHIIGSVFISFYDIEDSKNDSIYILAKQFIGLVSSFNSGEITFNINEEHLNIKCGNSNYKLPSLNSEVAKESFSELDVDYYGEIESESCNQLKVDQFKVSYNSVNHCLSKDNSQKNLQSIFVNGGKMIACDSVRGASVDIDSNIENLMLHQDACNCICNSGAASEITLYKNGNKLTGKSPNFIFMTVIDSNYPYSMIQPILERFSKNQQFTVEFDPENVIDKLNRVLLFTDSDTNSIKVDINSKEFNLSVENKAKAKETINVFNNKSQKPISLFVDGKNLKEALSKSLSETKWATNGESDVQFIYDGSLLQFFNGLSS